MSFNHRDNYQVLMQLWGRQIPDLTPEQIETSIKLWQKIKVRKQQAQNVESDSEQKTDCQ